MATKRLGKKLWDALETAQGNSFVSDDMCSWPDDRIIAFCLANLPNVRKVAREFAKITEGYEFAPLGDTDR